MASSMIVKSSLALSLRKSCLAIATKPVLARRSWFRNSSSFVDDAIQRLHMAPNDKANFPSVGNKRMRDFDIEGGTYVVTGGAQGLGLNLAEALCEAGAKVHCLDRRESPSTQFFAAQDRAADFGGFLHYRRVDVQDRDDLDNVMSAIASENSRLDGLVAAAGIQRVTAAVDYKLKDIQEMMNVNYTGVFLSATSAARQMMKYKSRGSMVLIGSMSGLIANRNLICPVYNSSKAAVIQLARNLAMEWGRVKEDGTGGIRVNCLSPGNILTPMVEKNFEDEPHLKKEWEEGNMLGRIADPAEFKGAVLFMLSNASSFMTGSNLVIDGGYTAW